jgi:GAF domain-containing protein
MTEREQLLSTTFVELTDTLVDDFDVIDLLTVLAHRCTELVHASATGILLADDEGVLRVIAASSEQARLLELFQLQNEQGPCLDCFAMGRAVGATYLEQDQRWPLFGAEALSAGFRAVQAVPLRLRAEVIGALNMFFDEPDGISDGDLALGQSLADVATIAILQDQAARQALTISTQLQSALTSRITIEQAKGILAERGQLDMDEAFTRLRRFARDGNHQLSAIAEAVVTGSLDDQSLARLLASH